MANPKEIPIIAEILADTKAQAGLVKPSTKLEELMRGTRVTVDADRYLSPTHVTITRNSTTGITQKMRVPYVDDTGEPYATALQTNDLTVQISGSVSHPEQSTAQLRFFDPMKNKEDASVIYTADGSMKEMQVLFETDTEPDLSGMFNGGENKRTVGDILMLLVDKAPLVFDEDSQAIRETAYMEVQAWISALSDERSDTERIAIGIAASEVYHTVVPNIMRYLLESTYNIGSGNVLDQPFENLQQIGFQEQLTTALLSRCYDLGEEGLRMLVNLSHIHSSQYDQESLYELISLLRPTFSPQEESELNQRIYDSDLTLPETALCVVEAAGAVQIDQAINGVAQDILPLINTHQANMLQLQLSNGVLKIKHPNGETAAIVAGEIDTSSVGDKAITVSYSREGRVAVVIRSNGTPEEQISLPDSIPFVPLVRAGFSLGKIEPGTITDLMDPRVIRRVA